MKCAAFHLGHHCLPKFPFKLWSYHYGNFGLVTYFGVKVTFSSSRLPNARMLNIWLNIKNNCSMKKIINRGMSQRPMDSCVCGINTSPESIPISSYYFSRDKHVLVEFWYTYFTRNVNLTFPEFWFSSLRNCV